jgi:hypothetical protein
MLKQMMGLCGDSLHDHLLEYAQAVSGAALFALSLEMLKSSGKLTGLAMRGETGATNGSDGGINGRERQTNDACRS